MTIKDKTTLKSYFNAGDVPTEQNFSDLIDTIFSGIDSPYKTKLSTISPLRIDGGSYADLSSNRTLTILPATNSQDGSMSFSDKIKLDLLSIELATSILGGGSIDLQGLDVIFPNSFTPETSKWIDGFDSSTGIFSSSQPSHSDLRDIGVNTHSQIDSEISRLSNAVIGSGSPNKLAVWIDDRNLTASNSMVQVGDIPYMANNGTLESDSLFETDLEYYSANEEVVQHTFTLSDISIGETVEIAIDIYAGAEGFPGTWGTFNIRRNDISGSIVATKNINRVFDGAGYHYTHWEETIIDDTPASVYVLTTSKNYYATFASDYRSIIISKKSLDPLPERLPIGTDGDILQVTDSLPTWKSIENSGIVPSTRTLTTTAPLTIDGGSSANLSANRTIAINAATPSLPGSMSALDKTKLDYLTLASATSIIGGGSISLGGYNFTIPASGTAVLGSGISNRISYWNGTNELTSSDTATFDIDFQTTQLNLNNVFSYINLWASSGDPNSYGLLFRRSVGGNNHIGRLHMSYNSGNPIMSIGTYMPGVTSATLNFSTYSDGLGNVPGVAYTSSGTKLHVNGIHTGNLAAFAVSGGIWNDGQYTSTLVTGMAPFVLSSTTLNINLNADLLDGYHASSFALASDYVPNTRTITEGAGLAGNSYDLSVNRTLSMGTPSSVTSTSTNSASGTTHSHIADSTLARTVDVISNTLLTTQGDIIRRNATVPERYGLVVPASPTINFLGVANGELDPTWKSASSNPGASADILQSNASGYLQLIRVGLGVSPSYPLHVSGQSYFNANSTSALIVEQSGVKSNVLSVNTTNAWIGINQVPILGNNAALQVYDSAYGSISVSNKLTDDITIGRLVVPSYTKTQTPVLIIGGATTSSSNGIAIGGGSTVLNSATNIGLYTTSAINTLGASTHLRMFIDGNGKVGLGTGTSLTAGLTLTAYTGELVRLDDSSATGNPYLSIYQAGTRRSFIQHLDSGDILQFVSEYGDIVLRAAATAGSDSDAEYMRIKAGGNIGIHTGSPASSLDIWGVSNDTYPTLTLTRNDTSVSYNDPIGNIDFASNDSTPGLTTPVGARIQAIVPGYPPLASYTNNSPHMDLGFHTMPAGSNKTLQERMRISSEGDIRINAGLGILTGYKKLDVGGTGHFFDPNTLGSELATYGDFSATTNWSNNQSTLDISSGKGKATSTAPVSSTYFGLRYGPITVVPTKLYKVQFTYYGSERGGTQLGALVRVQMGTSNGGSQLGEHWLFPDTSDTTYTFYVQPTTTSLYFQIIHQVGGPDAYFTIDNYTVKEVTGGDVIARGMFTGGDSSKGLKIDEAGDTYWKGSGAGLPYGSMYGDDVSLIVTISAAGTYYALGTGLTTGLVNQFTFSASTLTCAIAGIYKIDWGATVSCGSANQEISGAVMINSTVQLNTEGSCKSTNANSNVGVSGTGIISLAAGDVVKLCFENESGTNNLTITHATLSLIAVGA